ncbi:MAG: hypothetical protein KGI50_03225 [Patescibacteria group bacterium]|nr:hypothetical protein [Patescibacteria group bacterium]MDE2438303.1 hypothetical protein [Patescibacteria group bacterium]
MKGWLIARQKRAMETVGEKERLLAALRRTLEAYEGSVGHLSVFCVPVRMKDGKGFSAQLERGRMNPEEVRICLVFEKEDTFLVDGEPVVKPEAWGLPGGGVDIIDIKGDGTKEREISKSVKAEMLQELLDEIEVDGLIDVIRRVLHRETGEEAGLEVDPLWNYFRIDAKSSDETGRVNLVVTVLCDVASMSGKKDEVEIEMVSEFSPHEIVNHVKGADLVSGKPRWMYRGHGKRLGYILSLLGRDFEGVSTALRDCFGR